VYIQCYFCKENRFWNTQSDPEFCQRGESVSYIDARNERFQNAILACILLRKNFRNSVLACSITKVPLCVYNTFSKTIYIATSFKDKMHMYNTVLCLWMKYYAYSSEILRGGHVQYPIQTLWLESKSDWYEWMWVGWVCKVTIFWCIIQPHVLHSLPLPYLLWITVSYIVESYHSCLAQWNVHPVMKS
jgi:hypothetical protein